MDFLQLYGYYFVMIWYYLWCKEELEGFYFINATLQRTYLAFMIIHALFTFCPTFFTTLVTINSFENESGREINCCSKLGMCLFSLFQMLWMRIAFGPKLYFSYNTSEDNKIAYCITRGL